MKMSYYTHYIVLGGSRDGTLYPRTAQGLEQARQHVDADHVCPARPIDEDEDEADDLRDYDDYGCDIDRSNASVWVKP